MRRTETAAGSAALAAALALSACSLAPDYHRPAIAAPAAYKELPPGWSVAQPAAGLTPASWWQAFGDTTLNGLEERIEGANPSLAAAVARHDAALGQLGVSRADLSPEIDADGGASRERVSKYRPLTSGHAATYNDYQIGASFSYEIDLFGRVRNSIRASRAEANASDADVAGVRLGLQTQLATIYFQMRGLDAREELLKATVAAYQRADDLTETRHAGGIASGLDTSRARTQLSSARAELSDVHAQRAAYEHAIAALVGETASSFAIPTDAHRIAPIVVPPGTPSTLLQRRPDIDAAERRVFAANARIGVARAALYPALSLGGSGGFLSTGAALISKAGSFWALGPAAAALPLLDGGRRRSEVRVARADFDQAAATYKQTVLTAFKEVEDDLALGRDLIQEERDESDAAAAAERTRDLALVRYRDGASDYLEVVTAQTAALDAERSLLDLRTRQLTTGVDTVRALGGAPQP
ncbi:MAG TPA: efflux transporter outer membrane subunit [Sphingomonas sp.]